MFASLAAMNSKTAQCLDTNYKSFSFFQFPLTASFHFVLLSVTFQNCVFHIMHIYVATDIKKKKNVFNKEKIEKKMNTFCCTTKL